MSKIRSKNTKFEKDFISLLNTVTPQKFHLHDKSLRGAPDIVFAKHKVCVFLDSDFWHGWQYPRWKHLLKDDFWRAKIENNRKRDDRNTKYLRSRGWLVMRFWEHQLRRDLLNSMKTLIDTIRS